MTDGIYAVAMTLLVIELKLPAHDLIRSQADLVNAVGQLVPKFIAWIISFLVLALFWLGHHRMFNNVRHVDGKLIALNLLQLAFASLIPFSSALSGEFGTALFSQIFYSANMIMLAMLAILIARYIFKHPALCVHPMGENQYRAAQVRIGGLIFISIVAVVIATLLPATPAIGNMAFMLMIVIMPISRRIEARNSGTSTPTNESTTLSV